MDAPENKSTYADRALLTEEEKTDACRKDLLQYLSHDMSKSRGRLIQVLEARITVIRAEMDDDIYRGDA